MTRLLVAPGAVALAFTLVSLAAAETLKLSAERSEDGVTIKVGDQLFTRYLTKSGAKPIFWPVMGPTGKEVTRAYPMAERPNERNDHPHQRSFWFTHGNVNGVDFWAETKGHGQIHHREFKKVEEGEKVVIVTVNDWVGPDGEKICEDERRFEFFATPEARWIDCQITVKATEGPVTFGDTKEGSFGVRVAASMKVTAGEGGEIVNSEGQKNTDAWGKRAKWVDYHGPVQGEVLGIAILDHPQSFRHPTYWHVRDYGLFAANPFGVKDFTRSKEESGDHVIPKGEAMTLRYRVLFHKGDHQEGRVAESYADYAKTK